MLQVEKNAFYATGRRKHAVARVWMMPGTGKIAINKRDARGLLRSRDVEDGAPPAARADRDLGRYDIYVNVAAAASRARRTRSATASRAR